MDEATPILGEKVVLPGRPVYRVFLILLLAFAALLVAAERGVSGAPLMVAACLFALVFFGIQLIPGANRLEITREGFTCYLVFRAYPMAWKDVGKIATDEWGNVVWDYAPHVVHPPRKARSVKIARQQTGFDACLPETYGQSAPMLAALLNRIREESQHGEQA